MSTAQTEHVNLDSSQVRVSSDTVDVSSNATSIYTVLVNSYVYEFASNHRDFGVEVGRAQDITFDEQYSLQGGLLRLGSRQDTLPEEERRTIGVIPPCRFGTWEGERFSIHTNRYGGDYSVLIAAFDAFEIIETSNGIRLIAKFGEVPALYNQPSLLKDVSGIGLLQIRQLTRERIRALPTHRGTPVRGGELFVKGNVPDWDVKDCSDFMFWLAGDTAVTAIMPHPNIGSQQLVPRISDIAISWEEAVPS